MLNLKTILDVSVTVQRTPRDSGATTVSKYVVERDGTKREVEGFVHCEEMWNSRPKDDEEQLDVSSMPPGAKMMCQPLSLTWDMVVLPAAANIYVHVLGLCCCPRGYARLGLPLTWPPQKRRPRGCGCGIYS